jgi:hypothetical protein
VSNPSGIIVGREVNTVPLRFYVVLPSEPDNARPDSVRSLLESRLSELETHAEMVRDVLATQDPERAEHFLFDGVDVAVSQVVLRPRVEQEAVRKFTLSRFSRDSKID